MHRIKKYGSLKTSLHPMLNPRVQPMTFQRLPDGLELDLMTDQEVRTLRNWAVAEGWNPGISDMDIARRYDPEAFIALRRGDELLGGGSIFSYEATCGFMGLFIMRKDLRQRGLGNVLWQHRRNRLQGRLKARAPIGMDGVLHMVPYYSRGGFDYFYEDVRFQGIASGEESPRCRTMNEEDFNALVTLDTSCFPGDRSRFLKQWLAAPGVKTAVLKNSEGPQAFGALRPAEVGYKFGPVLAYSAAAAEETLSHLMSVVSGEQIQLDIPEVNTDAMAIAASFGLADVFRCAKMVLGEQPTLRTDRIFGLTSFEFG